MNIAKLIFSVLFGLCPVIELAKDLDKKPCDFLSLALGGAEFLDVEAELSGTDASGDESDHGEVEETNLNNPFLH